MKFSAVKILIAANVVVFLLQLPVGRRSRRGCSRCGRCSPSTVVSYFHSWQIITYAFLHSTDNIAHLLFNMLGLWMFGAEIERYVGPRRLLACYFASVVTAALTQLFVPDAVRRAAGADDRRFRRSLRLDSGLCRSCFPSAKLPCISPIPMPAWLFATLYAGYRAVPGRYRHAFGSRAFRALGRHGRQRLGDHAMAARAAAKRLGSTHETARIS